MAVKPAIQDSCIPQQVVERLFKQFHRRMLFLLLMPASSFHSSRAVAELTIGFFGVIAA